VITVGLNPSHVEFPADDPFQRFPGGAGGDPHAYLSSLNGYFRTEPYTKWFNPSFEPMLNGLDCSYYGGHSSVALHTDLCSVLATNPTWSKLEPGLRSKLQAKGVELWHDLVRYLSPDVIIISVAKKNADLIQFPATHGWRSIYTVKRENPYKVLAKQVRIDSDKRALVVFGRAANLPFGTISKATKRKIGAAMKDAGDNNRDQLCFVQFLHPGGEHRPDHNDVKEWNRGTHKRKFMRLSGRCVRRGKIHEGDVLAWGEWEAQSTVIQRIEDPVPHGPRYVFRPYYSLPKSYRGLQNTDPFIFEGFQYTGCQQHTVKGPTQLRFLNFGSVILFGSHVADQFALDTAFVVDHWVDFDQPSQSLRTSVSKGFWNVTLAALFANRPKGRGCSKTARSLRLYFGAIHQKPVEGMFSFFPARPCKEAPNGFARPIIDIPGIVNGSLKQGKRLNRQERLRDVVPLWERVCRQVEAQGCWLGVHADMPAGTVSR